MLADREVRLLVAVLEEVRATAGALAQHRIPYSDLADGDQKQGAGGDARWQILAREHLAELRWWLVTEEPFGLLWIEAAIDACVGPGVFQAEKLAEEVRSSLSLAEKYVRGNRRRRAFIDAEWRPEA